MTNLKKYLRKHVPSLYYALASLKASRYFNRRYNAPWLKATYKTAVINKIQTTGTNFRLLEKTLEKIRYRPGNGTATGQWALIYNENVSEEIEKIERGEIREIIELLSKPTKHDLAYGFDNLSKSLQVITRIETIFQYRQTVDHLIALAAYLGITRYENPEAANHIRKKNVDLNDLINKIFENISMNTRVTFHNPFIGERGLETRYGICTARDPAAIYQAILLQQYGKKICEIGGGIGRTGYFSIAMGATEYDYVDLPIAALFQSYFMDTAYIRLKLSNEEHKVEIILSDEFLKSTKKYDVVLNADSMTEMGREDAIKYIYHVAKNAKYFVSINHENNEFTIDQLVDDTKLFNRLRREKCWIRPGYLIEVYEAKSIK